MKCMKNERLEAYQEKKILKKLEKTLRIKDESVWERKMREISRERSNKKSCESHEVII